jgi:elongation factor 4
MSGVHLHNAKLKADEKSDFTASELNPEHKVSEQELRDLIEHRDTSKRIPLERTRNFCIIAHIDHGKSTLADRLLELTGNILPYQREQAQVLDSLEVERQRGITVKAQTASFLYRYNGQVYLCNLIDTPGHCDFSYEILRSMAACHGALLLVDASQGIQAQTLANYKLAKDAGLDIIPVLSKMDVPTAIPEDVVEEMIMAFNIEPEDVIETSAKSGTGIHEAIRAVIERVRHPTEGEISGPATTDAVNADDPDVVDTFKPADVPAATGSGIPSRILVFDSWYDTHRGVICLVYMVNGQLSVGDRVGSYHAGKQYEIQELGLLLPRPFSLQSMHAGQVGYVIANVKTAKEVRLGETFFTFPSHRAASAVTQREFDKTHAKINPLPGFMPAKSMVFAGIFPNSEDDFEDLTKAVERLTLNDPSVTMHQERSDALGFGFRCGFLGVLHMDVFCQRLEQEFGTSVILTPPAVPCKVVLHDGTETVFESASEFPEQQHIKTVFEPMVHASIVTPESCVGELMELCSTSRGTLLKMEYLSTTRVLIEYRIPLVEVVTDFYNLIKRISSGYASLDFEDDGYIESHLVKMEIKINGKEVDALAQIVPEERLTKAGREITKRVKERVTRQNFEIIIQACVGKKVLARERIAPFRKDVLIKSGKTVGGGDVTRKKKLLEKQKAGKKKLKASGKVSINQGAVAAILQRKP